MGRGRYKVIWAEIRQLSVEEKTKRGCYYCTELTNKNGHVGCPWQRCPYRELDKYDTYEDYLESEDSKIDVTNYFIEESEPNGYLKSLCKMLGKLR